MVDFSRAAIELLNDKYKSHGEEIKDIYPRVAKEIARHTPNNDGKIKKITKEYLQMMNDLDFLPNSPCIRNAGYGNMNKACFVLPVEDSISGIYKTLWQSAVIFKMGGGVGYNFSNLREKGAALSAGGTSSGVLSFMNLYDASTDAVKQGGFRRGASMGILDFDHPEITEFIQTKARYGRLTNFNLSVLVTDDFMKRVNNGDIIRLKSKIDKRKTVRTISASDIFWLSATYAWANGCPGLIFFDRINKDNMFYPDEVINATNPCGEVPLFPFESCCLGSINLSHCVTSDGELDFDKLKYLVERGTFFLMGMNKSTRYPEETPQCYDMQNRHFRLGLGVMGYADMLMKMHVMYDSTEALRVIDKIGRKLRISKKYAPLSVCTMSIAPTGSLSILADCSSGIEPVFAEEYERHLSDRVIKERRESEYLRISHEIEPIWHLKTLARWQKWIDNGVSKTINLPIYASQSDVADIYMKAWRMGCKGITVYRDTSKEEQPYRQIKRLKCDDESCYL
jgi:ribonucleoside-diphosphate reductase alpha chain